MGAQGRLRGLFVNHVSAGNVYGAATSFHALVDGLRDRFEVHVLAPCPLDPRRARRVALEEVAKRYRLGPERVSLGFLPWDGCYEGATERMADRLGLAVRNALHVAARRRLRRRLARFDFVYLNSLVLNAMIPLHSRCIVHAREVLLSKERETAARLSRSRGVVYIDGRTREAFKRHAACPVEATVTNPFDMRHLAARAATFDIEVARARLGVPANATVVFACVGTISPIKGVDLVIEAFRRAKRDGAALLVVGATTDPGYERRCREIAAGCPDIVFSGEQTDMDAVYLATDHVVRGDPDFRLGRTVYEGLFAGCGAIIPGLEAEVRDDASLREFSFAIGRYAPGDMGALAARFREAVPRPLEARTFEGNTGEHFAAMADLIERVVALRL